MSELSVRPAAAADIPWMLGELEVFGKSHGTLCSLWPESPDHAKAILKSLIEKGTVWIAEREMGSLLRNSVGFIAGLLSSHPYNPQCMVLSEMVWWVTPLERHTHAGTLLLDEFLRFGREHAHRITVSIILGFTEMDHGPLLDRGLRPHELSFLYEVGRASNG